jgi:ADP-ribose pyrophosphatase YjhB (NUDIX family)
MQDKQKMSLTYTCSKGCCTIEELPLEIQPRKKRRGNCRKAGVFIYDPEEDRVLLVESRGQLWGPPKGTLEIDIEETSCDCAIREVKEETGIELVPENFLRAIKIKNRAVYYYTEMKMCPVKIQEIPDNDANGITWIKIACLEEFIQSGNIILNQHCKTAFEKFLGKTFPKSGFTKVEKCKKWRF